MNSSSLEALVRQDKGLVIPTRSVHVVYCRSGRRSALAAQTLVSLGYPQVRDLGPIIAWKGTVVK